MSEKKRKYYTVSELLDAALVQAKEDPLYQKALQDCILDYELVSHAVKYDRLVKCEFDPVGLVRYGGSEGIYGSILLYGKWAEGVDTGPYTSRMNVYTLKTLETSKEAYLGMAMLVNLIAYYADQVMRANLDRFD